MTAGAIVIAILFVLFGGAALAFVRNWRRLLPGWFLLIGGVCVIIALSELFAGSVSGAVPSMLAAAACFAIVFGIVRIVKWVDGRKDRNERK